MVVGLRVEDRLEGISNFRSWKSRMLMLLNEQDLKDHVLKDIPEPKASKDKTKHKKNEAVAMRILMDSVRDHLVPIISNHESTKKMYDTLRNLFENENSSRILALKDQLRQSKFEKDDSISTYFVKLAQIRDQLAAIGETIPDRDMVLTAMAGLPPDWALYVKGARARGKLPSFDEFWVECIQEETRENAISPKEKEEEITLATKTEKRKKGNQNRGRRDFKPRQNAKFKREKPKCYTCGKPGHLAVDCWKNKGKGKYKASTTKEKVAPQKKTPTNAPRKDYFLITALSGSISDNDVWLIDNSAFAHMTGSINFLSKVSGKHSSLQVELGDNAKYQVKGTGSVSFQLDSGDTLSLGKVLLVSGLKKNLISVSTLENIGMRIAFIEGKALMWSKDSSIDKATVIGTRTGGLYKLAGHQVQALVHDSNRLTELWHRRFAHLHYRALPALKEIISGVPELPDGHEGVCMGCALGKNTKKSFPSSDGKSKGILDLVHSDVCGPMTVASLGGFLYFTTFIDDFSRKTWIYFLKRKDEVFSKFKEFKALVENSTNRKIKVLRSDNGGEYTSKDFNNFCKSAGIKKESTVPYNP